MQRTIRVKGKSKISIKPDMIRLDIIANEVCKEYDEVIEKSALCSKKIKEIVKKSGLNDKELKTVKFDVDSKYESYRDKDGNYKSRLVGFQYTQKFYIQFPNDNLQLGKILYELSHYDVNVEFSIKHTVKDITAVKNELLTKAVQDSKNKAVILSKASGVMLGDIINIDYSWGEIEIYSEPIQNYCLAENTISEPYNIDIEADDIDVQDTVTIVWEIK
ncbi:SIMPL domain-containing protein [Parvimonas micra]|uniref:SIMPL domain-containing protein n=1 Tax=Parvimonas micra TaxID=33033 RepID=UPI0020045946|nr:SIMPL domain-containing protein [Parvimonas micra]MCK6130338.1 SIMPL domain-containing protein [Parvimonas micra]MCK6135985.1 SIMPL domain-containing protein [Parvimonas micra]MCK6137456.1 SIMPL domain-containing protein [Parvimonas micra]MCK6153984.1 SIMPL domain-containing protein [Parvimonas micra]